MSADPVGRGGGVEGAVGVANSIVIANLDFSVPGGLHRGHPGRLQAGAQVREGSTMSTLRFVSTLWCMCGLLAAQAREWTVGSEGADFRQIQDAIDAASPGDLIRVASRTTYEGFVLDKPLRLLGEPEEMLGRDLAAIEGTIVIRDIGTGQMAVVENLFQQAFVEDASPMIVEDCAGVVVINGRIGGPLKVMRVQSALLRDCSAQERNKLPENPLEIVDSNVVLRDCVALESETSLMDGIVFTAVNSRITMLGGRYSAGPNAGPLRPIGVLTNSHVTWSGGFYDTCGVLPCTALFFGDATSTAARSSSVYAFLSDSESDENEIVIRLFNNQGGVAALVFSQPTVPTSFGLADVWIDPATLVPLVINASGELNTRVRIPRILGMPRLGIPFMLQAGIVTEDGELVYSDPLTITF